MTWKNDFVYSRVDKVIIMYVCLLLTQLATINTDSINNQILYFTLTWRNWSKNYSWTLAMKYMEYRPLLLPICSMVTGGARWTFKTMPGHLCPAWDSWQQALSVCVSYKAAVSVGILLLLYQLSPPWYCQAFDFAFYFMRRSLFLRKSVTTTIIAIM